MILEILKPKKRKSGNNALCVCDYCGIKYVTKYAEARDSNKNYCSLVCTNKGREGRLNHRWVNGGTVIAI